MHQDSVCNPLNSLGPSRCIFSPIQHYRLWNPVQFWCYGEDYRAKKYRIVPREATVPDDPALKEWVHCFAEILDEEVSSVVVTAQDNAGKGRVAFADANVVDPWYEDPSLLSSVTLNNRNDPPSFFLLGTRKSEEELDAKIVVTGASASKNYEREFGITVFWVEPLENSISDGLRFRNEDGEDYDPDFDAGARIRHSLGYVTLSGRHEPTIGIANEVGGITEHTEDLSLSVHSDVIRTKLTQDESMRTYYGQNGSEPFPFTDYQLKEEYYYFKDEVIGHDEALPDSRDDILPKIFTSDAPMSAIFHLNKGSKGKCYSPILSYNCLDFFEYPFVLKK